METAYGRSNEAAKVISAPKIDSKGPDTNQFECSLVPLSDINYTGVEDKFANSILHVYCFSPNKQLQGVNSEI